MSVVSSRLSSFTAACWGSCIVVVTSTYVDGLGDLRHRATLLLPCSVVNSFIFTCERRYKKDIFQTEMDECRDRDISFDAPRRLGHDRFHSLAESMHTSWFTEATRQNLILDFLFRFWDSGPETRHTAETKKD